MTTATRPRKTNVLAELDRLEADLQNATAERDGIARDSWQRQCALNGRPGVDHTGGLLGELNRMRQREPRAFNPNGTAIDADSDAGRLVAEIEATAAPLGDLAQQREHAERIVNRCQQDLDAYIAEHFEQVVEAMRPEAEALAAETNSAARVFASQLDAYLGFYGRLHALCAVYSKRPGAEPVARRIQGGQAAQDFKKVADSVNLPAPTLEP